MPILLTTNKKQYLCGGTWSFCHFDFVYDIVYCMQDIPVLIFIYYIFILYTVMYLYISYVFLHFLFTESADMKGQINEEMIKNGKYIRNGECVCKINHSAIQL